MVETSPRIPGAGARAPHLSEKEFLQFPVRQPDHGLCPEPGGPVPQGAPAIPSAPRRLRPLPPHPCLPAAQTLARHGSPTSPAPSAGRAARRKALAETNPSLAPAQATGEGGEAAPGSCPCPRAAGAPAHSAEPCEPFTHILPMQPADVPDCQTACRGRGPLPTVHLPTWGALAH